MPCELIHVVRDAGEETMRREQLPHQFFTYRSVGRRRIRTARESRVDEKLRHTDVVLQRESEQSTFLFRRHPHNVSVLTSTRNTATTLGHPVRVSSLHVINHARPGSVGLVSRLPNADSALCMVQLGRPCGQLSRAG